MSDSETRGRRVPIEDWVDTYGDFLYRYAISRLRDANQAEEVVQETFLAGIRSHDQFSGSGAEQAWLLGILKRKIIDLIRARRRRESATGFGEGGDPSEQLFDESGKWRENAARFSAPDQQLTSDELWQVVEGCLTHLPKGQADVFVLSVMEEMDSDDICKELGITPSNLWVRLHRARLRLANCVGSQWAMEQEESHA